MPINDDSRSRHPSRLGPRTPVPTEDEELDELVQRASKPTRSLADLYRRARKKNLIKPHAQYT